MIASHQLIDLVLGFILEYVYLVFLYFEQDVLQTPSKCCYIFLNFDTNG